MAPEHPEPNVGVGFVDLSGIDDPPPMGDDRAAVRLKHTVTRMNSWPKKLDSPFHSNIVAGSSHKLLPFAVIGDLGAAEEVALAMECYLPSIDKPLLTQSLPGNPRQEDIAGHQDATGLNQSTGKSRVPTPLTNSN